MTKDAYSLNVRGVDRRIAPKTLKTRPRLQEQRTCVPRQLHQLLIANNVVLFVASDGAGNMGPLSSGAVKICDEYEVHPLLVDVSKNPDLERQVQGCSGWQFFPQLFVFGEFIGGSLLLSEFFASGEFDRILAGRGITRARKSVESRERSGYTGAIWRMAVSREIRQVHVACADGAVRTWSTASRLLLSEKHLHTGWVNCVTDIQGKRHLAAGLTDGSIRLFDPSGLEAEKSFTGHRRWVNDLVQLGDGSALVSASADRTLRRWSIIDSDGCTAVSPCIENCIWSVCLTGDGSRMVAGDSSGTVSLWDPVSLELAAKYQAHRNCITHVNPDPDTGGFCSASLDGVAKLWDSYGGLVRVLGYHEERLWSVIPIGSRTYATACADQRVRLWNAENADPQELAILEATPIALALCPSADAIIVGCDDGTVTWIDRG